MITQRELNSMGRGRLCRMSPSLRVGFYDKGIKQPLCGHTCGEFWEDAQLPRLV